MCPSSVFRGLPHVPSPSPGRGAWGIWQRRVCTHITELCLLYGVAAPSRLSLSRVGDTVRYMYTVAEPHRQST